jgi:excinuclease ABC subunit B
VHIVDVLALGGYEDHLLAQIASRAAVGERTLVTCITKSSAEALSGFLNSHGVASLALHSGVKPLERLRFLEELRSGRLDALVGCNLLREGLDLPEVSLVCVLSADKQGLLRSATSLVQTIGRAARHVNGAALLLTLKVAAPRTYLAPWL